MTSPISRLVSVPQKAKNLGTIYCVNRLLNSALTLLDKLLALSTDERLKVNFENTTSLALLHVKVFKNCQPC